MHATVISYHSKRMVQRRQRVEKKGLANIVYTGAVNYTLNRINL